MSKEAMKLALEALESCTPGDCSTGHVVSPGYDEAGVEAAIIALREALNAPLAEQKSGIKQVIELYDSLEKPAPATELREQEPVECKTLCELCVKRSYHFCANSAQTTLIPSPPAQRTWVGLTDEEMREVYKQTDWDMAGGWEYERAIEAKLRSKNEDRN